jgi:hypothetical protein
VPLDSFQAALVTSLLVLPGALYTWGIERVIGHWGVGLADRLLRFIGISACFHVALAPLTYHSYRLYFRRGRCEPPRFQSDPGSPSSPTSSAR